MKQKHTHSQTTRPCCTQPQAKDMQIPFKEHLWANLVDSTKLLLLIIVGYALFVLFGFLFQQLALWLWGN